MDDVYTGYQEPTDSATVYVAEISRTPPPPRLIDFDLNKDGVINVGDQSLQATFTGAGHCPDAAPRPPCTAPIRSTQTLDRQA